MKNCNKNIALATMLGCAAFSFQALANEAMDKLNVDVELRAAQIDEKYGVLLDYQERSELKLDLIVNEVTSNSLNQSVQQLAEAAVVKYQITDPVQKRKLLIKLEAHLAKSTGGGGTDPEYP